MATTIAITCPECKKQIKAPAGLQGKKIRCKACDNVFVVKASAAPKARPEPKAAKPQEPLPVPLQADEEENANPYGMSTQELTPRCPQCAFELEEADAVICLNCGYNLLTRTVLSTKKTIETDGFDYFVWWLPAILCILLILVLIGLDCFYVLAMDPADDDPWWRAALTYGGVKVWVVIVTLFIMFFAGKFAFKRLVYDNVPPEKELRSGGR